MSKLRRESVTAHTSMAQWIVIAGAVSTLVACSTRLDNAPVIDRSPSAGINSPTTQLPPGAVQTVPGAPDATAAVPLGPANNSVTPPVQASNNPAFVPGAATPMAPAPSPGSSAPAASGPISFTWPVRGPILHNFDSQDRGVDIGGAAGDPVRASSEGRVVYAGNGLRGYGNLIIIKHDATFLTAYAHNRALLVKEGDAVTKGQKIAEMGNTDADKVMLHFEVRKQGKPVDPLQYLPPQ